MQGLCLPVSSFSKASNCSRRDDPRPRNASMKLANPSRHDTAQTRLQATWQKAAPQRKLAAFAIEDVTAAEEEQLLKYPQPLKRCSSDEGRLEALWTGSGVIGRSSSTGDECVLPRIVQASLP